MTPAPAPIPIAGQYSVVGTVAQDSCKLGLTAFQEDYLLTETAGVVKVVAEGGSCDAIALGKRTGNKIYRTATMDKDIGGGCILNYTTKEDFTVASDNSAFTGTESVTIVLTTGATCTGLPVLTPCTSELNETGTLCTGCYDGCSPAVAPGESEPGLWPGLSRGVIERARLRR